MKTHRRRARGMTLIEVMIAAGIFAGAMLVAFTIIGQSGEMIRNDQEIADSNDNSRIAGEYLARMISGAGLGAPGGLYIGAGNVLSQVNSVYGYDGNNGPDDLWIIGPAPMAMGGSPCNATSNGDPGATVSIISNKIDATGLPVRCVGNFLDAGTGLLVSNLNTAALITGVSLSATGNVNPPNEASASKITFREQTTVTNFSDNPQMGGFRQGDMIYGSSIQHFSIGFVSTDAGTVPALFVANGYLNTAAATPPFLEDATSRRVVIEGIEDLQLSFVVDPQGLNDPTSYSIEQPQPASGPSATTVGPAFVKGLRAVNVSVVSRSGRTFHTTAGTVNTSAIYAPLSVENHTVAATGDGYRRNLYSRRVELSNMGAGNL